MPFQKWDHVYVGQSVVLTKGSSVKKDTVFRDCKDGLLAAEGEGGLRAGLAKKGIFALLHVPSHKSPGLED